MEMYICISINLGIDLRTSAERPPSRRPGLVAIPHTSIYHIYRGIYIYIQLSTSIYLSKSIYRTAHLCRESPLAPSRVGSHPANINLLSSSMYLYLYPAIYLYLHLNIYRTAHLCRESPLATSRVCGHPAYINLSMRIYLSLSSYLYRRVYLFLN